MRPTGVDTSVDSTMDEASGAGGTRGLATTGEGVEGSGGCVAPIKRARRLRRTSSMERVGVVMLVTVVVVLVTVVVVGCPT
jgi:hypothetical protein